MDRVRDYIRSCGVVDELCQNRSVWKKDMPSENSWEKLKWKEGERDRRKKNVRVMGYIVSIIGIGR